MDRIELAERRYHDIVGDDLPGMPLGDRYWKMPTAQLLAWIDDYVVPAVEENYARPLFRDHATWPQRVLSESATTLERAAVERMDRALVDEARALRNLSRNRLVVQSLEKLTPSYEDSSHEETVTVTSGECAPMLVDRHAYIPHYIAQTESMSQRDWTDLVCLDDYFVPVGGMMRTTPLPANVTEGAFVVSLSPHLFMVGDCITRSMMQRIRSMLSFLAEARQVFYEAVRAAKRPYKAQVEAEREAHLELGRSHADLRRICLTENDAGIREACMTLVQVYAEFHPAPDLDWLGISDRAQERFKGRLRHNIESTRELETVERIAGALSDARHLYRELTPEHSAIDAAIASGGLVLIKKGPEAYWERRIIDQDWDRYRKAWQMLWKLTDNARSVSPINDIDLYQRQVAPSTMYNRWNRLAALLPASLWPKVEPSGAGRATYRLDLPLNKIHIFESRSAAC